MMQTHPSIPRTVWLRRLTLGLIILFSLTLNYIRSDFLAHGSDEFAYMRSSNQLIFFENRTPQFFFPITNPHTFPYMMGVAAKISGLETALTYRVLHICFLILLIISAYRLGSIASQNTGLVSAVLIAIYPSSSAWQGIPAAIVPSSFLLLGLMHITHAWLKKHWSIIGVWIVFLFFFYWWGLLPMILYIGLLYCVSRGWIWRSLAVALAFVFIGKWVFLNLFQYRVLFTPFSIKYLLAYQTNDYFQYLINILIPYVPLLSFFVFLPVILKKSITRPLGQVAFAMALSNLVILLISQAGQSRTIFFFFTSTILILACTLTSRNLSLRAATLLLSVLLILTSRSSAVLNFTDIFGHTQTNRQEISMFRAFGSQAPKQSLVLSDYNTMELSQYFFNNINGDLLNRINDQKTDVSLKQIMNFMAKSQLLQEDLDWLSHLQQEFDSKEIYIVISGRTRAGIDHYLSTEDAIFTRVLPVQYPSSPRFAGEEKFRQPYFSLIYNEIDTLSQKPFSVYRLQRS